MKTEQFNQVVELEAEKSIFGQWVSIISVTDTDKNLKPEYRKTGILKISMFQAHVRKASYIDLLNTSTGAIEAGIEFKPKRASYYNSVAHNGFCSELKSNPAEKYFIIKFNENDEKPAKTIYVNAEMKELKEEDILLEKKEGNVRTQLVADVAEVKIRNFKTASIAKMSVGGLVLIDDDMREYIARIGA